jgi:hypothetical protein
VLMCRCCGHAVGHTRCHVKRDLSHGDLSLIE